MNKDLNRFTENNNQNNKKFKLRLVTRFRQCFLWQNVLNYNKNHPAIVAIRSV